MFREAEVLMDDMGNDQKERASAEAMYGYLRKAYFKDLKVMLTVGLRCHLRAIFFHVFMLRD